MVPSVVEFKNPGTMDKVTEQVNRIASGLGKANSIHPRQKNATYAPKVMECVAVEGEPATPKPHLAVEWTPDTA